MIPPEPLFASFGTHNVLAVILGGGRGTRLFPLTKDRAKPAVPLGGKYRLVDIPISNCINSGLRAHLPPDAVQLRLAPSAHRTILQVRPFLQRLSSRSSRPSRPCTDASWYQGTADAVRKNLIHFQNNAIRLHAHPERRPALPHGLPHASSASTSPAKPT